MWIQPGVVRSLRSFAWLFITMLWGWNTGQQSLGVPINMHSGEYRGIQGNSLWESLLICTLHKPTRWPGSR